MQLQDAFTYTSITYAGPTPLNTVDYNPQEYALAIAADSYGMELVMAVPEYIKVGQRITAIYELK